MSAFSASFYASLVNRKLKPFNPILGETYEYVTEEFTYISEQVCHHPPVSAYHAENQHFKIWG